MLALLLAVLATVPEQHPFDDRRVPRDPRTVAAALAARRCADALKVANSLERPSQRLRKSAEGCSGIFQNEECRRAWSMAPTGPVSDLAARCAQAYCPLLGPRRPDACTFVWGAAKPGELRQEWDSLFQSILIRDWGGEGWTRIIDAISPGAHELAHGLVGEMTPLAVLASPDFTVRFVARGEDLTITLEDAKGTSVRSWKTSSRCTTTMEIAGLGAAALTLIPVQWRPWASGTLRGNRDVRFCKLKPVVAELTNAGLLSWDFLVDSEP